MRKNPDMSELIRLSQTPSGRRLITLLKDQNNTKIQEGIASVAAGKYDRAKEIFSELLLLPEVQDIFKEIEESQ